jgi:hypothetical protein
MTRRFLVLFFLVFSLSGFSEPEVREICDFFRSLNYPDKCEEYKNIPRIPVDEFIHEFISSAPLQRLGAGVEGVVFKDSRGRAWKISIAIAHALGLVEIPKDRILISNSQIKELAKKWKALSGNKYFRLKSFLARRVFKGWPMRSQSLTRELVGNLLWKSFSPGEVLSPSFVSEDQFGFCTTYVPGPQFYTVLEDERYTKNNYSIPPLWKDLVKIQKANERMLEETGFAVDAFSPLNMLVTGSQKKPRLVLIDNGLSAPQKNARDWLRALGKTIPTNPFTSQFAGFITPMVVSPLIVSHGLWKLDYNQAMTYMRAYSGKRTQPNFLYSAMALTCTVPVSRTIEE